MQSLHPCWLKDVPGALLWEDLNSTLKQFIQSYAQEKKACLYLLLYPTDSAESYFVLEFWFNLLSLCSLCPCNHLHAMTWFARGKKNIYMNLKGVIPVSCFCKAVTDNGNCLLWIFMIECYGNRCSWELYSNYSGVQCFLRNKQCNKSLKLGVKLDSRWRCHFLPYYMFHVIFFFTSE